jgi:hypothetical protein
VLWAILILDISGDTLLWNIGHIIINIVLVIPLIIKAWPVTLKGEQRELYDRFFKSKLTKKQFKKLMDKGKRKEIDVFDTQLIQQGNPYDELLFIFRIPRTLVITIYYDDYPLDTIEEGDFVGMLETTFFLRKERLKKVAKEDKDKNENGNGNQLLRMKTSVKDKLRWDISVKVDEGAASPTNEELVYYRWEREDLVKILYDKEHGNQILNGLYSIWLERTIHIINYAQDKMAQEHGNKLGQSFKLKDHPMKMNRKLSKLYQLDEKSIELELPYPKGSPIKKTPF